MSTVVAKLLILAVYTFMAFGQNPTPLEQAVKEGKVDVEITGSGGSAGDAILINVQCKQPVMITISLTSGTVFKSVSGNVQDMVGASIRGERFADNSHRPATEIVLNDNEKHSYVVEAYCLDFHKPNPSSSDSFAIAPVDERAAKIITAGWKASASIQAIQAALSMDREGVGAKELKERFAVNDADISEARGLLDSAEKPADQPPTTTVRPKKSAPTENTREQRRLRVWTDFTGKHRIEAVLVDSKDGKVRLRKEDGTELILPVNKLSAQDQEFLKSPGAFPQPPCGLPPRFATVTALDQTQNIVELAESQMAIVREFVVIEAKREGKSVWMKQVDVKPVPRDARQRLALSFAEIFDTQGQKLSPGDASKRLTVGMTVLVSGDGKKVDPAYLSVMRSDTLVVVAPLPCAPSGIAPAPPPPFAPGAHSGIAAPPPSVPPFQPAPSRTPVAPPKPVPPSLPTAAPKPVPAPSPVAPPTPNATVTKPDAPKTAVENAIEEVAKLGGTFTCAPGESNRAVSFDPRIATDVALEHLKGLSQLRLIYLPRCTKITDAGLGYLKGLTQLQTLDLSETQVSDAGLEHIKGLTQLQTLDLSGTKVSDAGLERLKGLTRLRTLNLGFTKISDAGLGHLKGLTQLQTLVLRDTAVTEAAVKMLREALPNCKMPLQPPPPGGPAHAPRAAPATATEGPPAPPAAPPPPRGP